MWMEEKLGTRINLNRVDEAISTGAQEVAVGCPFCRVMVSDGMTGRGSDVAVLDVAQALLRTVKNESGQRFAQQSSDVSPPINAADDDESKGKVDQHNSDDSPPLDTDSSAD